MPNHLPYLNLNIFKTYRTIGLDKNYTPPPHKPKIYLKPSQSSEDMTSEGITNEASAPLEILSVAMRN